jgi:hypothetical protein
VLVCVRRARTRMYTQHCPQTRGEHICALLNECRLAFIEPCAISDRLDSHQVFVNDVDCQRIVLRALKQHVSRKHALCSPRHQRCVSSVCHSHTRAMCVQTIVATFATDVVGRTTRGERIVDTVHGNGHDHGAAKHVGHSVRDWRMRRASHVYRGVRCTHWTLDVAH